MSTLNWWAIIAATLVTFVLGFLWYGPFLGKLWMKEVGLTENDAKKANMAKIFGLSLLFQFSWPFA